MYYIHGKWRSIHYAVVVGWKRKDRNIVFLDSAKHWIMLFIFPVAGKNSKSAKVFSTLSWSWSFKSQHANSESSVLNSSDASGYGYHGKTLEKLYDEEQKLYKLVKVNYWTPSIFCSWSIFHWMYGMYYPVQSVKGCLRDFEVPQFIWEIVSCTSTFFCSINKRAQQHDETKCLQASVSLVYQRWTLCWFLLSFVLQDEEFARLQYKRHISMLQKLESGEHDKLHAERIRDAIEELQTRIISLEEAVSLACFSISKLRDEELYPQIIELSAG